MYMCGPFYFLLIWSVCTSIRSKLSLVQSIFERASSLCIHKGSLLPTVVVIVIETTRRIIKGYLNDENADDC
jgi:hypothetical protein